MADYLQLTVGEKFDHNMPNEGMSVILASGTPMLTFNFSVSNKNIAAFLNGPSSFGLFSESSILFFLFRIKEFLDWSDLAFTVHLAGDEKVEDASNYLPFHLVLLVESSIKTIKGLRVITVSPTFRTMLARLTQEQAKECFDTIDYYKKIGELYKIYPLTGDMLKKAMILEEGGITLPT
ncbi:MAG: hypothetical protein ACU85E_06525 [Gammaproteobacteria bacterium]